MTLEEKFSLLLWDYQELELAFEKVTGGKWIRKSNTPQRTWVGLTDAELAEFSDARLGSYDLCLEVEAKIKEKNG